MKTGFLTRFDTNQALQPQKMANYKKLEISDLESRGIALTL